MTRALQELDEIDAVFSALAHASRRHILIVLNARGGRVSAGAIAARFSCSWPTTSRHLRVLLDAGLVRVERQGREWIYVLNVGRLNAVAGGWLNWFEAKEKTNVETDGGVRAVSAASG
ncbi:MAG TPA: metalloregulator ArsR/SmtB family transcription factor [Rhizomicrobium sp.]